MVEESPLLCLKWNHFQDNFTTQFAHLKSDENFVDVTFSCDGKLLRAHRVVLSASSPYLTSLFKENPCKHPVIILDEIPFSHLECLLAFIYTGAVSVAESELPALLESANVLQIRGLSDELKPIPNEPSEDYSTPSKRVRQSLDAAEVTPNVKRVDSSRRHSKVSQADAWPDLVEPKVEVDNFDTEDNKPLQSLQRIDADFGLTDTSCSGRTSNDYLAVQSTSTLPHLQPAQVPDWEAVQTASAHEEQSVESRRRHSLDPRPCPICKRHYSNLSNLRQHLRLIHNPRLVKCNLCNRTFKTELYLRRHVVGYHYDSMPGQIAPASFVKQESYVATGT